MSMGSLLGQLAVIASQTAAPAVEETLFLPGDVPSTIADPDTSGINLGVKFIPSVNGQILGVRFYKGSPNTGTHVGRLWSSGGTQLATVTFTGESASGWQEMRFAAAASVVSGTTYVVSYFAPNGRYSSNGSYFATSHVSGSLTAPSDAAAGGNGVYLYSGAAAFPDQSFGSTNYWVDAIFVAS